MAAKWNHVNGSRNIFNLIERNDNRRVSDWWQEFSKSCWLSPLCAWLGYMSWRSNTSHFFISRKEDSKTYANIWWVCELNFWENCLNLTENSRNERDVNSKSFLQNYFYRLFFLWQTPSLVHSLTHSLINQLHSLFLVFYMLLAISKHQTPMIVSWCLSSSLFLMENPLSSHHVEWTFVVVILRCR